MRKNFIWTFTIEELGAGVTGFFSLEYHIRASKMHIEPRDLIDSRIWMILKNDNEYFLYGVIMPALIEKYDQGDFEGDYVLQTNAFGCLRFMSRHGEDDSWLIHSVHGKESGIFECSTVSADHFIEMFRRNQKKSFAKIPDEVLKKISVTALDGADRAVPDQMARVIRELSYSDVAKSKSSNTSLSAVADVTLEILKVERQDLDETQVLNLLEKFDPVRVIQGDTSPDQLNRSFSEISPMVDTYLQPLDTSLISARHFVASAASYSSDWIEKTNDAEAEHEAILKDVAIQLSVKGFEIFKTRSLDIYASDGKRHMIIEIKSANVSNFSAQAERGIVQLMRYMAAWPNQDEKLVAPVLLINNQADSEVVDGIIKMAGLAGIHVWLYEHAHTWPNRVVDATTRQPVLN